MLYSPVDLWNRWSQPWTCGPWAHFDPDGVRNAAKVFDVCLNGPNGPSKKTQWQETMGSLDRQKWTRGLTLKWRGFLHQWCNFSWVRIPGCAAQPYMEDPMVCKHKFIRIFAHGRQKPNFSELGSTILNNTKIYKWHGSLILCFFRWSSNPQIHGP